MSTERVVTTPIVVTAAAVPITKDVPVPQSHDVYHQGTPASVNSVERDAMKMSRSLPLSTVGTIETSVVVSPLVIPISSAATAPNTNDSILNSAGVRSFHIGTTDISVSSSMAQCNAGMLSVSKNERPIKSIARAGNPPVRQSGVSVEVTQVPCQEIQPNSDASCDVGREIQLNSEASCDVVSAAAFSANSPEETKEEKPAIGKITNCWFEQNITTSYLFINTC